MDHSRPRRLEERIAREVMVVLVLLLVALVQTTLLPRPLGTPPNLLLMLVICRALIRGPSSAARWAFYGGLALDLCANSALGTHALAMLVAVLVAVVPLVRLGRDNWLLPLGGTLLGALTYQLVMLLLTMLLVGWVSPREYGMVILLPEVLLTLVPILPVYLLMRWSESRRRGEVPIDIY